MTPKLGWWSLYRIVPIQPNLTFTKQVEMQVWEIAILMRKAYSFVTLLDDKIYSSYLTTVNYYMCCVIASTYHEHLKYVAWGCGDN